MTEEDSRICLIKRIWRRVVPDKIKSYIGDSYNFPKALVFKHYGIQHKGKIFFVIRFQNENMGLCSILFCVLPFIKYAKKKGYLPVVDYTNYFLPMLQDNKGKNSWELYFEQPTAGINLEDVYSSQNVILAPENMFPPSTPDWRYGFPTNNRVLTFWNSLIKEYIRPISEIQAQIDDNYIKIFPRKEKVLGVSIRTGHRWGMLLGKKVCQDHYKQPSCEEIIKIIENKMKKWNILFLFLSVDDREYSNTFKEYFGKKCLVYERNMMHFFENSIPIENEKLYSELEGVTCQKKEMDYMTEVYLLARCDSLYACVGGGAEFAYYLNGGEYEHCEIYNKGLIKI